MAEGIATNWLKEHGQSDWLAVSAGIHAVDGMATSAETIKALDGLEIAYEGTSTHLTNKMVKEAQIIFCMSKNHLAAVRHLSNRVELLDQDADILDPIGQDQSVYDALAEQMKLIISTKLGTLTKREV